MAVTDRDPLLAPFDALIGTGDTEAKHRLVDEVVTGRVTFEWLEGGHFVVLRSHNDHDPARRRRAGRIRGRRATAGGPLGPDEFEFVHQLAEAPGEWQDDLRTVYRRRVR